MRFVPIKTPEQQSGLVLHRTRHLLIRPQTAVINAIRAHLAEFGIVAPVGRKGVEELLRVVPTETTNGCLMSCVHVLAHWVLNCSASRSRFWNSIE
jgi:transposase